MEKNEITLGVDARELQARGTPMFPCASYRSQIGLFPGGFVPWHWHEEVEAVYVQQGVLRVDAGGQVLLVPAGDLLFVNTNVLHGYANGNREDCVYLTLCFSAQLISGFPDSAFESRYVRPVLCCRAMNVLHLRRDVPWQREAIEKVRRAHTLVDAAEQDYGWELEALENLCGFWRLLAAQHRTPFLENGREAARDSRVRQMLDYLREHYQEPLTINQLAQAANISQRECFRCFQRCVGASPTEYLLRYRVGQAARLLIQTDLAVTDVGLTVGFNHPSYFGKLFRTYFGCTPSQYRRAARSLQEVP